jgi:tetratricopeptide (TPR) repeat protein
MISPMKAAVDADAEFLHQIGATNTSALRHGVRPRVEKFFQNVAARVGNGSLEFDAVVPSLEFICRRYPDAWLILAKLYEENGGFANASESIRRYLEQPQGIDGQRSAWEQLARLYSTMRDWTGAVQAWIRICELPHTEFSTLSNTANSLNSLLREDYLALDSDEKRILYRELTRLMEQRASEADATDLSRLAWLYLHMREVEQALATAERGLAIDPQNEHCLRLAARLRHSSPAL